MMRNTKRRGERGQTIILVAISILTLLAMAALAIDVVTLYVASGEIKRAADAAALAAGKAIADSGATTLQSSDANLTDAETLAAGMANAAVTAILPVNTVAGGAPSCSNCPIAPDWTTHGNGNPIITVSLQQTGLPTFFSRIWGRTGSTVSASSTAEVYNPSNSSSSFTPIQPSYVKPFLVANFDPYTSQPFVTPSTNTVEIGIEIGREFNLRADCPPSGGCSPPLGPPNGGDIGGYPWVYYAPVQVAPSVGNNVCPVCAGTTDYEKSIACADATTVYTCGSGSAGGNEDVALNGVGGPSGLSATALECLTNASGGTGLSQGQDQLTYTAGGFPTGTPYITSGSGLYSGHLVSTSPSIVTIPILDANGYPNNTTNIVGFMQAFVNQVQSGVIPNSQPGDINVTLLNISGCDGTPNTNTPVVGGMGTSSVPVRLIAAP